MFNFILQKMNLIKDGLQRMTSTGYHPLITTDNSKKYLKWILAIIFVGAPIASLVYMMSIWSWDGKCEGGKGGALSEDQMNITLLVRDKKMIGYDYIYRSNKYTTYRVSDYKVFNDYLQCYFNYVCFLVIAYTILFSILLLVSLCNTMKYKTLLAYNIGIVILFILFNLGGYFVVLFGFLPLHAANKGEMITQLEKGYNQTDETLNVWMSWNTFQEKHGCCGVDGPVDYKQSIWLDTSNNQWVPPSCCKPGSPVYLCQEEARVMALQKNTTIPTNNSLGQHLFVRGCYETFVNISGEFLPRMYRNVHIEIGLGVIPIGCALVFTGVSYFLF